MISKKLILVCVVFVLGFSQTTERNVDGARLSPRLLNYQGYVTDTLGNPLNDTLDLIFRVYSVPSGGTAIWTELQLDMVIANGIFNAVLGSTTPIPDSVFTKGVTRWLELRVGGQTMSPRTQITAAGYAFTATYSDTAEYARSAPAIDSCRISANSHKLQGKDTTALDARYVNEGQAAAGVLSGTYPNPSLADNSVTTPKILDSAVTMAKINRAGANSGQVIKWNGTAWQPDIDANFPDDDWTRSGGKVYTFNLTDSVGIRMTTPRYALDVNGVICGGVDDTVNALDGGVLAGWTNLAGDAADDTASVVCGGYNNTITSKYSFIGGGTANSVTGAWSTIGGGDMNLVNTPHATVGGGINNLIFGTAATIAGGSDGIASGPYATIGGGRENIANYNYACVGGGWADSVQGYCGGVFSGYSNLAGDATNDTAAVVCGGYDNSTLAKYTFVGGGLHNSAGHNFNTVVGGDSNTATAQNNATICGGHRNYNDGPNAFIGGGQFNYVGGGNGVICGGYADTVLAARCFIGGGYRNKAYTNIGYWYAAIGGGSYNATNGECAAITGGSFNYAGCEGLSSYYQTIGGGFSDTSKAFAGGVFCGYSNIAGDTVYDTCATVCGGWNNSALARYSFIGGGRNNCALDLYAVIGGGQNDSASGQSSFVGGGGSNKASAFYSSVVAGFHNIASGPFSIIGGGANNDATYDAATVCGGADNTASGYGSFIGGGGDPSAYPSGNTASGIFSAVVGGSRNGALANYAFIGTGYLDSAYAVYGAVVSGYSNRAGIAAADTGAVVVGGLNNTALGRYSFVGGGDDNTADGTGATVSGGHSQYATGNWVTISGGYDNWSTAQYSTVAGGYMNRAHGNYSMIPGGDNCYAESAYAFSAGRRAKSYNNGCFTWGDATNADLSNAVQNRWLARCAGGVYFYTNAAMNTGVYVAAGSGTWNSVSDRNLKENFTPVDGAEVLDKLARMPIQTWNYKSQDETIRHIGPMAQDFAAFGVGDDDKHIATIDADGIALAAIQELNRKLERLETENRELRQRIETLESK